MGRDQFFNAEHVQNLGAGRMLMPDSSSDVIAQAATDILRDDRFTVAATRMAVAIGGCGGALQGRCRARNARSAGRRGDAQRQPGVTVGPALRTAVARLLPEKLPEKP